MTFSRVIIARPDGTPLEELHCRARRSWLLSDVGEATLYIPRTDPKYTPSLIQYGNLVLIENRLIGNWGGVIREPITRYNDRVEVGCLSSEDLLKDRRGEHIPKFNQDDAAGARYQAVIEAANNVGDLRLRVGDIWGGGLRNARVGAGDTMFSYIIRLASRAGADWNFVPGFDAAGGLIFNAGFWPQEGHDFSATKLLHDGQGANIEEDGRPPWTTQGRIVNNLRVNSMGSTVQDTFVGRATNDDSLAIYGVREGVVSENVSTQTNADAYAESKVNETGFQTEVYCITAVGRRIMPYIRLGNSLALRIAKLGLDTVVRVVGYAYDDTEGSVALTLWG